MKGFFYPGGNLEMNEFGRVNKVEDRFVLFGLHEMAGIGWKSIEHIVQTVPTLGVFMKQGQLPSGLALKQEQIASIRQNLHPAFIESRMKQYERAGVRFLTIFDEEYPYLLKQISRPPWVLYYKGDIRLCSKPAVTIVGTRRPTAYGRHVARELAKSLAQSGVCVVSGMARGIDAEAHRGALEGGGGTIAVLGCGADVVYPSEHRELYSEICRNGLVLSEYPLGTRPHRGLFPARNRIVAGLSLGTAVIEAADRSGSLITADCALDESRDVFAVPGPITSPKSRGCHWLIRQGAKLVTDVHDILEEYQHIIKPADCPKKFIDKLPELSDDEFRIVQIIGMDPLTFDEILEKSQFTFGHLHSVLLSLQMKKKIEQLPGSMYIKV
jgi:DNA processing protein